MRLIPVEVRSVFEIYKVFFCILSFSDRQTSGIQTVSQVFLLLHPEPLLQTVATMMRLVVR